MRRLSVVKVSGAVLAAVAVMSLPGCRSRPEWTSASAEALREFELGQEARMKLYSREATEHFQKALELDPDFVVAKLVLSAYGEKSDDRERWIEELRAVDVESVTERERYLIEMALARFDRRPEEVSRLIREYALAAPDDPYVLAAQAEEAWGRQEWDAAAGFYERLLEVDPNWVLARNHLGYLAMGRGRFAEAEDHFETYCFIAPDQPNPHDSMGELLTVTGRYGEALASLEKAVSLRPDFCASYFHMLDVLVLEGRPYDGYAVLDRAERECHVEDWGEAVERGRCELAFWNDYLDGDFDSPWREERRECRERFGKTSFLVHRLAALSGRLDEAEAVEVALGEHVAEHEGMALTRLKAELGVVRHMKGVRQLAARSIEEAVESFREADSQLWYWGQNQGIVKLFNRLHLASGLEILGEQEEAAEILEAVREVNAPFAEVYPEIRDIFMD